MNRRWFKFLMVAINVVAMAAVDLVSRLIKRRLNQRIEICDSAEPAKEGAKTALIAESAEKEGVQDAPIPQTDD